LAGTSPYEGLRVLDLSRVLAGPWATQILADLGADVVKVEQPEKGDDTRLWGPPYLTDRDGNPTRESAYYLCTNRNKRSVAIDLTRPEGQDLIRRLAAQSDVLVENFRVDGLRKYGLDYASLAGVNGRLVYCSITGFGQTGPMRGRGGYDLLIQAMGGLMSITGLPDDQPGGGPVKVGVAVADVFTGLYATIAIQAALAHRRATGRGQHIDMALFDTQAAVLANQAMNTLLSGVSPARMGSAHPNVVPYQAFATATGHIVLAIGNDTQFQRFCAVAGIPQLADDPRFATNQARINHRAELVPMIAEILGQRPSAEWIEALEQARVPCGPINAVGDVFAEPQAEARNLVRTLDHALGVTIPTVANPIRFSEAEIAYHRPPPLLGQHTEEVLHQHLGLAAEDIAALAEAGVIAI
jgi:crotonobetainyl-CoA:carnitine CoA-transferase CaiB-like acyl-CoA transferase